MLGIVRWFLIVFCLVNLVPLLTQRGGLGEYARGATITTAQPGTCFEDIDQQERGQVTCAARWGGIDGSVLLGEQVRAVPVVAGVSGSHYEVRLPAGYERVQVFADGSEARQTDPPAMALGAAALLVMAGLLAWQGIVTGRGMRRFSR